MSTPKRKKVKATPYFQVFGRDINDDPESVLVEDEFKADMIVSTGETCGRAASFKEVWTLPRTAEDYDAMVEQMALGIARCWKNSIVDPVWRKEARAALRAIGITRPKETKQ